MKQRDLADENRTKVGPVNKHRIRNMTAIQVMFPFDVLSFFKLSIEHLAYIFKIIGKVI